MILIVVVSWIFSVANCSQIHRQTCKFTEATQKNKNKQKQSFQSLTQFIHFSYTFWRSLFWHFQHTVLLNGFYANWHRLSLILENKSAIPIFNGRQTQTYPELRFITVSQLPRTPFQLVFTALCFIITNNYHPLTFSSKEGNNFFIQIHTKCHFYI